MFLENAIWLQILRSYKFYEVTNITVLTSHGAVVSLWTIKGLLQTQRFFSVLAPLGGIWTARKITAKFQDSSVFKALFIFLRNEQREYSWKVSITNKLKSISGK